MVPQNPFSAAWSSKGDTICLGHWELSYQDLSIELPAEKRDDDLGTYGIYSYIYPDDPDFAEGLKESDWILENMEWLAQLFDRYKIPLDEKHLSWLYQALNLEDWRCGSCGGCN
ncbi:MAG: hypothetical protein HOM84_00940 [Thiotrichales bacterium]|nr:hypothetical protein [Thiotrichales bacterium]MBT3614299.1 hypothetical protein [Thiotrichales bacterium]MBT3752413.1 hypothetical protein [Thiotrichales bacterium]MBT3837215.1 hypothetical protein [Thiotrichales bacterium]MBT4151935.1 hypothetical protein [Thiotrichales bacterium]